MQQFREVSRTRTIYSTETHTSDFILYTFWNGKPVQFFQERCCVVMTGCQENKSCSKVLNFLERLDDRIRCTHKGTVAVVEPWKDVGSNKSLGCVFSEKPADWTNAFKLEISSLADFYQLQRALPKDMALLCSNENIPITDKLFGDDADKAVKRARETFKIKNYHSGGQQPHPYKRGQNRCVFF